MYFCTTQTLTLLTEFGRIYERMEHNEFSSFIQWRKVDCVGFCVKVRTSVCVTVRYYQGSICFPYRVFSRDATAAMLVSLNKETAAMLVSPTNPPGIPLYSYVNTSFCFG